VRLLVAALALHASLASPAHAGRRVQPSLKLAASENGFPLSFTAANGAFPAVASDGVVAQLFEDAEDFSGARSRRT